MVGRVGLNRISNHALRWNLIAALFILFTIPSVGAPIRGNEFVHRVGRGLFCGGYPFYAVGVNSYFLQNIAAYGDTNHVQEIFREANELDITTIRTWGFFDCEDSTNTAGIQFAPGKLNEDGLRALDYVIAIARKYSIRLIVPLVNNWDDYGGMKQYVRWYAQQHSISPGKISSVQQRTIVGADGRSYQFVVGDTLTHDHFYTQPTIKQWYESYISILLNRVNSISGTLYKDDPTILVWELANEPRSSDRTGEIVNHWMDEMSTFVKSIDTNHLVSTGEEGLEVSEGFYASSVDYDNQTWLFDGTGGTSFRQNASLPNIDIASIHCYPSAWGLTPNQAIQWLRDHQAIADQLQKPLIFGEIGTRRSRDVLYNAILNESYYCNTAGVLLWQFVYDGRLNNDGYAFSYPADGSICDLLATYSARFSRREGNPSFSIPVLQNYPNPFNSVTVVSFTVTTPSRVQLAVFNALGQRVDVLVDDELSPGTHFALFSTEGGSASGGDGTMYSSGVYYLRLSTSGRTATRRVSLIK